MRWGEKRREVERRRGGESGGQKARERNGKKSRGESGGEELRGIRVIPQQEGCLPCIQ